MTTTDNSAAPIKVVLTTCSNQQQAETLASGLLAQRLAACINVLPPMQSWYRWQQKVCNDPEVQLVIKTSANKLNQMMAWLEEHHPYETPELLVIAVEDASQAYRQWILDEC